MFLFDILFPKRCLGCGRVGRYFCFQCRTIIKLVRRNDMICPVCGRLAIDGKTHPRCRSPLAPDGLVSFFRYSDAVRKAVKTIKYRLASDVVDEFMELVPDTSYNLIRELIPLSNTVLVPIPLHTTRMRERGFNQADLLARRIAGRLGLTVRTDIIIRIKYTEPQVTMKNRHDRLKNMDHVFEINRVSLNAQRVTVILIDDVFTTGATIRAAAAVLEKAGVQTVWAITIAR